MLLAAYQGRTAEASRADRGRPSTTRVSRRRGTRHPARALDDRGPRQRPRSLRRRAGRRRELASDETPGLFISDWALPELIEAAVRSGNPPLAADALQRLAESTERRRRRLGAGHRGPLAGAAERRRTPPRPVPRGARTPRPHPAAAGARPRPSALRRVAASREPSGRRPAAAARRVRHVHRDGRRRVRRAGAPRAARHGREGAQAARRRRATSSRRRRSTSPGWPGRAHQSGDRRRALHQRPHGRVAPAQGVHQARDQLPQGPRTLPCPSRVAAPGRG